ncbi:unnamed protein product, partial [Dovyalis caffra]
NTKRISTLKGKGSKDVASRRSPPQSSTETRPSLPGLSGKDDCNATRANSSRLHMPCTVLS